jgi:hypothetical protein
MDLVMASIGIVFVASCDATRLAILILRHRRTDQFLTSATDAVAHRNDPDRHFPDSFPILSRFMSAKSARRHSGEKMP